MNYVVLTSSGKVIVRPDTTKSKDTEDIYLPDFVNRVSWTPVLVARICKPGRSVGLKFAGRYYDTVGYGVLLYPEDFVDGSEEGFARACCLDHTTHIRVPDSERESLPDDKVSFSINGQEVFSRSGLTASMIDEAIVEATRYCFIRIGDFVAIELQPRETICSRSEGKCYIRGTKAGRTIAEFNIIF